MKAFFSPYANLAEFDFDSTRKHDLIAKKLQFVKGIELVESTNLPLREIREIHSAEYIGAIISGKEPLASSSMLKWDSNTLKRALGSCGALLDASYAALKERVAGAVVSGFHHSCYGEGGGFCTLNGLVLSALAIQRQLIADGKSGKILILDLDFHTGNGTQEIIERFKFKNIKNLTVYGSNFGSAGYGWHYENANQYSQLIEKAIKQIEEYEFILYQAGVDPHQDSAGGMPNVTTELLRARDREVFKECRKRGIPIAFCLAGGYSSDRLTRDALADLHINTFKEAVRVYN